MITHDIKNLGELKDYLAFRNEVFKNPTPENSLELWKRSGTKVTPDHQTVPLAAVHKARILWRDSTPEMVVESAKWLKDNGYLLPSRPKPEEFIYPDANTENPKKES